MNQSIWVGDAGALRDIAVLQSRPLERKDCNRHGAALFSNGDYGGWEAPCTYAYAYNERGAQRTPAGTQPQWMSAPAVSNPTLSTGKLWGELSVVHHHRRPSPQIL